MPEIAQLWNAAWWSWTLLKHEYNLLIRLWPALPAKRWTHFSVDFLPFHTTADSPWISTTPHQSPSSWLSASLPLSQPSLSQCCPMLTECKSYCSLFHQAPRSLSNADITRRDYLYTKTPKWPGTRICFQPLQIYWITELTLADILRALMIFWGFKSITVQAHACVQNHATLTSCIRLKYRRLPDYYHFTVDAMTLYFTDL